MFLSFSNSLSRCLSSILVNGALEVSCCQAYRGPDYSQQQHSLRYVVLCQKIDANSCILLFKSQLVSGSHIDHSPL